MISKKKEVKQIHEGVAGKYVKKENPPEIPSQFARFILCHTWNYVCEDEILS